MTTEQQRLLEFAAKACGIGIEGWHGQEAGYEKYDGSLWNPLTSPADCAEMCAKLEITCLWVSREKRVTCSAFSKRVSNVKALYKDHDNSRLKAWMHAATMVAAKIGGME